MESQFLTRGDYVVQVVKAWEHYFTYNMFSNFEMYL